MSASLSSFDAHSDLGADLRLDHLLGNGRHGTVFAAHRPHSSETVAVKIPVNGSLAAEAAALRRFSHPAIVRLIDGPLENGAIVVEFCPLGTLAGLVANDGPLAGAEVAQLLLPIAEALAHLHDRGWIHGDVNPTNIGLRESSSSTLLDFATARAADGGPLTQGTSHFSGPAPTATHLVDVRALAATAGDVARPGDLRTKALDLVQRIDSGSAVTVDELRGLLEEHLPTSAQQSERLRSSGPTPPGRTSDFGPRPPTPVETTSKATLTPLAGVIVLLVLSALFFGGRRSVAPVAVEPTKPAELRTAESTLAANDFRWSDDGRLFDLSSGQARSWWVGEPEDQAAVGDWSCDGTPTLGVYRPSTGEWFVFDSWANDAESTVESGYARDSLLRVDRIQGCSVPVVGEAFSGRTGSGG